MCYVAVSDLWQHTGLGLTFLSLSLSLNLAVSLSLSVCLFLSFSAPLLSQTISDYLSPSLSIYHSSLPLSLSPPLYLSVYLSLSLYLSTSLSFSLSLCGVPSHNFHRGSLYDARSVYQSCYLLVSILDIVSIYDVHNNNMICIAFRQCCMFSCMLSNASRTDITAPAFPNFQ